MVTVRESDSDSPMSAPAAAPVASVRPTNWAIAGLVTALMLGMAALGLAFALKTVGFRRANDQLGAQPPEPLPEPRLLPPAEWPGLGYLPEDVRAAAGLRVADAAETAAGRALLAQLGPTATTMPLGLSQKDVDNLLLGASLHTLPPRMTAVIHGSVGGVTGSGRTVEQHGKTLDRLKLWPNGPEGVAWRADRRTLIVSLLPEDFDRVPAKPQAALPMAELIGRLDPAALAWLVATVDANNGAFALLAEHLPLAERDIWAKLDAVAVSIRSDGNALTLTAHIHSRDAAAGEAITKGIAESLAKAGISVERPAAAPEHFKDWRQLTATADGQRISAWLAGLRGR
jgi:hypothetical protein